MSNVFERIEKNHLFNNFQHRENDSHPNRFPSKDIYLLTDQEINPPELSNATQIQSAATLSKNKIENGVFYIYFKCDSDALPEIKHIHENGGIYIPHLEFSKTSYRFIDRLAFDSIRKTHEMESRISHFVLQVHENICEALHLTKDITGDYVEIGVYMGGSALTALHYLDRQMHAGIFKKPKTAWLLDTFEGFNYPEAKESPDAIWAGTHQLFGADRTISHLKETFQNIKTPHHLIKSNICADTLPHHISAISVANIDVDMYEPTLAALQKVSPLIPLGGIIICEDPASTPGLYGAYLAMEEFLASKEGRAYIKIFKNGQYFLLKNKPITAIKRVRNFFKNKTHRPIK